jgi:hypothetical protein
MGHIEMLKRRGVAICYAQELIIPLKTFYNQTMPAISAGSVIREGSGKASL